jgi:hypothetical protein
MTEGWRAKKSGGDFSTTPHFDNFAEYLSWTSQNQTGKQAVTLKY